ncbi:hypothetical protein EG329_004336, partial [Mollisiaceae sp. DMI_Dod_QoI]
LWDTIAIQSASRPSSQRSYRFVGDTSVQVLSLRPPVARLSNVAMYDFQGNLLVLAIRFKQRLDVDDDFDHQ